MHVRFLTSIALFLVATLVSGALHAQVISAARRVDWSVAGYPGDVPQPATYVDVTDFGAANDGSSSTNTAISAAFSALGGEPGVVYFPAGTYLFTSTVSIPAGVVLRGASSQSVTLNFDLNDAAVNAFSVSGSSGSGYIAVQSGYSKGSSTLTVADGSVFHAGDFGELHETNGSWDTNPADWANYAVGQIVEITAVNGNTLTLARPLRITYEAGLNPEIRKLRPKRNVGVETLKIKRIDNPTGAGYNIGFAYAADCWVKGVESEYSAGAHVMINASTRIEVTGCYIHHAFGYDGSGTRGYGVTLNNHAGECLVSNNVFNHLRHAMMTKMGANGNVVAYNYSIDNYRSETFHDLGGDVSLHGHYSYANLFEGNIVQTIMIDHYWGPSGPYNTFFRNRTELYGLNFTSATGGAQATENQNVVGNDITEDNYSFFFNVAYGSSYEIRGGGHYEYGNRVDGDVTPSNTGSLSDETYYLSTGDDTCHLAATWPPIGVPQGFKSYNNRAKDRWVAGGVKTYYDLVVDAGPDKVSENGQAVRLGGFARGGWGTRTVLWEPASGLDDPTSLTPLALPSETTTYRLTVTDGYGCPMVDEMEVRVTGTVETPVITPSSGTYGVFFDCTASCTTPGSSIRYTTDGSDPTEASTLYTTPISIHETVTVKMRAFREGWEPSAIAEAAYVFEDTDECMEGTHECDPHATCINTTGGYDCACLEGFSGDGFDCSNICGDNLVVDGEDCEGGDCCNEQCHFKSTTVVCRAASGTCDVAETCTGSSGECPTDVFQAVGTVCGDGPAPCSAQDACDGSGHCLPHDFADNTPCNDGDACTVEDVCLSTICTGTTKTCEDDNPCTANGCNPLSGCTFDDLPDATACDDSDACTVEDACLSGECLGNTRNCDDDNGCTTDRCDSLQGCLHEDLPDATTCDDGDACTVEDACLSGECLGNTRDCDDDNMCTTDRCDTAQGCLYDLVADETACDDEDACTEGDACLSGECLGNSVDCDDGNQCTTEHCDTEQGCLYENVPDETACNDENACTDEDVCMSGECLGNSVDCDDENPCTVNGCDTSEGCTSEALPDWTPCDEEESGDFLCVDGACLSISDGERCNRPIPLEIGELQHSTTQGFLDTYAEQPPCLPVSTTGPDVFFEVQPPVGQYRLTVAPEDGFDPVLLLLDECLPSYCPTVVNAGNAGDIEQFAPIVIDEDGTSLWIVVDSTDTSEAGAFSILFEPISDVDGDLDDEFEDAEEEETLPADEDLENGDEPWESEDDFVDDLPGDEDLAEDTDATTEEELSEDVDEVSELAEITEETESENPSGSGGDEDQAPGVIDDGCHSMGTPGSALLWLSLFLLGFGLRLLWSRKGLGRE